MAEYLYAIQRQDGTIKVGRSTNVGKRFHRYFYGLGGKIGDDPPKPHQPVRVVATELCPDGASVKAEMVALKILNLAANSSYANEDFACSDEIAANVIRVAVKMVETGYA